MIEITRLFYYPIKSCRGIEVTEFEVGAAGPRFDRNWMIVDQDGKFITQRQIPKMALIETRIDQDGLFFKTPLMKEFLEVRSTTKMLQVTVWGVKVEATVCDVASNGLLSEYLEKEVYVVRIPKDFRPLTAMYGKGVVSFADSQQFLVISEESLADLSQRFGRDLEMERFRPNIVIRGVDKPYAEDEWIKYSVGELQVKFTKLCSRCVIVTLDPKTAVPEPKVLKKLAEYRRMDGGVMFGTQFRILNPKVMNGEQVVRLKVGDRINLESAVV